MSFDRSTRSIVQFARNLAALRYREVTLVGTALRRLEVDEEQFNWFVVAFLFIISRNIFRKTLPALLG